MPWIAKRPPALKPLRMELRTINGKTYLVQILPPMPARGAWFQEGHQQIAHKDLKFAPSQ